MARQCQEYKKSVEEKIEEPIRKRKEGAKKRCKKKKCKWKCLCCNKWKCWLETFFYWVVEWVVKIIVKWLVYVVCRIVSALITLLYTLAWGLKWLFCRIAGARRRAPSLPPSLDKLRYRTLRLEVVIIDQDENTPNPVAEASLDDWISHANRILTETARIRVRRDGEIRRDISSSLYRLDVSSGGASFGEWVKGFWLLVGRDSPRHLTVYAVGSIQGAQGLHLPFYGSVFVVPDSADTSLCHEIGHTLLAVDRMGHSEERGNLMFVPWQQRENDAGWPGNVPTLTDAQWRSMRQSRWLDWVWYCEGMMGRSPPPAVATRPDF